MQVNEMQIQGGPTIDGYGPGFFRVGGDVYQGPVTVLPGQVMAWGGYEDSASLIALADQIDVLFIGTGAEIAPLPSDFRAALEAAGIGIDIMASPTAARTYNVLLSEGRRIAVALRPV